MSWRDFYAPAQSSLTESKLTPEQAAEKAAAMTASITPLMGIDGEAMLSASFDRPLPPPVQSDGRKLCESVHRFISTSFK